MSNKAIRTFDLALFALFTHLATVSYSQARLGVAMLYTFAAASMAAIIVIKTD